MEAFPLSTLLAGLLGHRSGPHDEMGDMEMEGVHQVGDEWQLCGGDAVIGEIVVTDVDFPWLRGAFTPGDGFAEVAPLFAEELALSEATEDDDSEETIAAWEAVHERIAEAVALVAPSGPVAEFLLHIDGSEAWFRWIDEPSEDL